MALSQAQIIASAKAAAAQTAAQPTTEAILPTTGLQEAAAKAKQTSQAKRLAVAGAVGAVGFFVGGPIGAALGAAGGYGWMYIKEHGISFGK